MNTSCSEVGTCDSGHKHQLTVCLLSRDGMTARKSYTEQTSDKRITTFRSQLQLTKKRTLCSSDAEKHNLILNDRNGVAVSDALQLGPHQADLKLVSF